MTGLHRALFSLSGGRLGGRIWNAEVLLLETTGRRTGARRSTPLMFIRDGQDLVLVASNGGLPHHPSWYLNLVSEPRVRVQVGTEKWSASARTADADEKARLWPRVVAAYSGYDSYRRKTTRDIPLVILRRADT
jgi:deazaflavin-dependent oxidoreductase (nitroreductase family)